jgi:hypothetical protein
VSKSAEEYLIRKVEYLVEDGQALHDALHEYTEISLEVRKELGMKLLRAKGIMAALCEANNDLQRRSNNG